MPPGTPQAQTGSSLIEVLVTVTVLSLGIVAMASLQTTALRLGQSAYQRSQVVALSYQILDAMRANRAGAMANCYNLPRPNPLPSVCQSDTIASIDLAAWQLAVDTAMQPFTTETTISHTGNRFTVTIGWDNPVQRSSDDAEDGPAPEHFAVIAEL